MKDLKLQWKKVDIIYIYYIVEEVCMDGQELKDYTEKVK